MKTLDMHKIRKQLVKALDSKRYEHTQGVAYTSAALAMRYGEDIQKAELAGLLHDCAKCLDNEKKIQICKKHNIEISEAEQNNPFLLHAKVGGYLAKTKYKVDDEEIIDAIVYHTTGRPGMSLMEKIVYIADYIEPGKKVGWDAYQVLNEQGNYNLKFKIETIDQTTYEPRNGATMDVIAIVE